MQKRLAGGMLKVGRMGGDTPDRYEYLLSKHRKVTALGGLS